MTDVVAALLVAMTASASVPRADFFVATAGNDGWTGKLAAPNAAGSDGPFATLDRARQTVRASIAAELEKLKARARSEAQAVPIRPLALMHAPGELLPPEAVVP